MNGLADLLRRLDHSLDAESKTEIVAEYLRSLDGNEQIWAIWLLSGQRHAKMVTQNQLKEWCFEESGLPHWLWEQCIASATDTCELLATILPSAVSEHPSLATILGQTLPGLVGQKEEVKRRNVVSLWRQMTCDERYVLNRLLLGNFKAGVPKQLLIRAISSATGLSIASVANTLSGEWAPPDNPFAFVEQNTQIAQIHPFSKLTSLTGPLNELGAPNTWSAQYRWDGIQVHAAKQHGQVLLWSQHGDLLNEWFPAIVEAANELADGTIIEGSLVAFNGARIEPSSTLTKFIESAPPRKPKADWAVKLMAYDILEWGGQSMMLCPCSGRQNLLNEVLRAPARECLLTTETLQPESWTEVEAMHARAREHQASGVTLRRLSSKFDKSGLFWPLSPLSVMAVLVYAQVSASGRGASFSDYSFGVWGPEESLLPIAKIVLTLSDQEVKAVDDHIRKNTIEKLGPVRTVQPELVMEIEFDTIQQSNRHKSGFVLHKARVARWLQEMHPNQADTIEALAKLVAPD